MHCTISASVKAVEMHRYKQRSCSLR